MKGVWLSAGMVVVMACSLWAQRTSRTAELLFADPAEIVTTATRSQRSIEESPISVQVLTRHSLTDWLTVQEALERRLPDVIAFEGSLMRFLSVRGSFSSSEFNERTLVLLDGVPLNDPVLGHVPLMALPALPLERIEVVYGPGSALYGANAFAGVVALKTAPSATERQVRVQFGEGNGQRQSVALWGSYLAQRWHFSTFGWVGQDGGTPGIHNAARTHMWQSALRWNPTPHTTWTLRTLLSGMQRGVNGRTVAMAGTPNDSYQTQAFLWALEREAKGAGSRYHLLRLYGQQGTHEFNRQQASVRRQANYQRLGVETLWQWSHGHTQWTVGLEARQESAAGNLLRRSPTANLWSAYTQLEYHLPAAYLTVGLRHDNHSVYGAQRSVRGALTYSVNEQLAVRASYGTAFRAPNFAELYSGGNWVWTPIELNFSPVYVMGDPRLRPERITAWEIGIRHQLAPTAHFDLSYFDKNHENLISLELHPGHPTGITWPHAHYRNLMHYHVVGVAASVVWRLNAGHELTVSGYHLLQQHWGSHSAHPTVRQISLTRSRLVVTLNGRTGTRFSWLLEGVVPPYDTGGGRALIALALRYPLQERRAWLLRVDNLLNSTYALSPLLQTRGLRLSLFYQQGW